MEWIQLLCFGSGLAWFVLGIFGQQIPDSELEDWTANWTANWTSLNISDDWPPLTNGTQNLFPNISDTDLQSHQSNMLKSNLDGRDTSCKLIEVSDTLRVYQCNIRIPGLDAKEDVCGDISRASQYGCDWSDDHVTLCHRWRDRYTQSVTLCRDGQEACTELDSRYMICACSVFYSWSNEQYYTFCDCKGASTDNYDDGCAFSYFGLLQTPTDGRMCHTVCSKRSTCQQCDTGTILPSPGVVSFCMCEKVEEKYGRREICPCQEEYFNNTACSDEYEPYSGQCQASTTTKSATTTMSASTTMVATTPMASSRKIPGDVPLSPRKDPVGNGTDIPSVTAAVNQSTIPVGTTTPVGNNRTTLAASSQPSTGIKTTTANTDESTPQTPLASFSPSSTSSLASTQTSIAQTNVGQSTTKQNESDMSVIDQFFIMLEDPFVAGLLYGGLGLFILIMVIIILCLICCWKGRCRKRRFSESLGLSTLRADEFTIYRSTDNLNMAQGNSLLSKASTSVMSSVFNDAASAITDDSGPIYKDYFQVMDHDKASVDSLYYFKLENTPNGSISGADRPQQSAKVRQGFGSRETIDSCTLPDQRSTSRLVCVESKGPRNVAEPENPYYFKLDSKKDAKSTPNHELNSKQHVDKVAVLKGTERQESVEENPYYFKVDPKDEMCTLNILKGMSSPPDDNSSDTPSTGVAFHFVGAEEQQRCPIQVDDMDISNDYQSLQKRCKQSTSSDRSDSSRYSYLLKPQSPDCDEDYLSLRKIKPNQGAIPEEQSCEDHDYFSLQKTTKSKDMNSAHSGGCNPPNSHKEPTQLALEDAGQSSDYQRVKKTTEGQAELNGGTDSDYQLLHKTGNGRVAVTKERNSGVIVTDIDL